MSPPILYFPIFKAIKVATHIYIWPHLTMKWPLCWCDTGDDLTDKGDRVDPGVRLITWHTSEVKQPFGNFYRELTNMFRYCHFLRFGKQLFKLRSDRRVTLELGQYPLWYPSSDNEVATHQQLIKWHLCVWSVRSDPADRQHVRVNFEDLFRCILQLI